MNEWAFGLVGERYRKDEYRVDPQYMRVFACDREAAIDHLIGAVRFKHSKARVHWFRFTQKLPSSIGTRLRPKPTFTANKWAAVLALSRLATERPDRRITEFLLECMGHADPSVRKVAAYEAGPWINPANPKATIEVLRAGLQDWSPEVRRDACRRISSSATNRLDAYTIEARTLLPILRNLELETVSAESSIRAAINTIERSFADPATANTKNSIQEFR
jgi:hypothetical protein